MTRVLNDKVYWVFLLIFSRKADLKLLKQLNCGSMFSGSFHTGIQDWTIGRFARVGLSYRQSSASRTDESDIMLALLQLLASLDDFQACFQHIA